MQINEEFTKEEIDVVENYLFRRLCKLEELGLTDAKCYPLIYSFRQKLLRNNKKLFTNDK